MEMERSAVREGEVVRVNRRGEGAFIGKSNKGRRLAFTDKDSLAINQGVTVFYLGHMDEADNEYVIVKLGQIVAIVEEES